MATGRVPTTANSPLTAKGDLFGYSTTQARVAVGSDGDTLVADSAATVGLRYSGGVGLANPVINGGFDIWQRGTSVSLAASTSVANSYTADRFQMPTNANQACTVSRQATGDTTNLPNIQYCARIQRNSGQTGTGNLNPSSSLESVNSIPFAGKVVTFSFYARKGADFSDADSTVAVVVASGTGTDQNIQNGFTSQSAFINSSALLTATWQRFTFTGTVSTSATQIGFYWTFAPTGTAGAADYFEVTGVQLDVGSTALPFRRSGGTIQGELAACQRYFYREESSSTSGFNFATGTYYNTTDANLWKQFPVQMRGTPTFSGTVGSLVVYANGASKTPTGLALSQASKYGAMVYTTGITGATGGWACIFQTSSTTNTILDFSAEL